MTRRWLLWWAVCFGLWVIFVANLERAELLTGAVAAALAASVASRALLLEPAAFRPDFRWLARAPRLVPATIVDCGRLATALARRLARGDRAAQPSAVVTFDVGRVADDASNDARRAAITEAISFTPNTIVIDLDADGRGLVHCLVPDEDPVRLVRGRT